MALDVVQLAVLEQCARAMVSGNHTQEVKLSYLAEQFLNQPEDIVNTLMTYVESMTDGKRTIRVADSALFADPDRSINFYLVICSSTVVVDPVRELTDDMVLFALRSTQRSIQPQRRATPEQLEARRFDHDVQAYCTSLEADGNAYEEFVQEQLESRLATALSQEHNPRNRAAAEQLIKRGKYAAACIALHDSYIQALNDITQAH